MSQIFLSHSSHDNAIAEQLKARLEQWGHKTFLDFHETDGIIAGIEWRRELYAKLRKCRAVVILCSHASMASQWCFAEIFHADALGKPVFPIKIDDVQLDPILTNIQVINATAGWGEAYRRLEKGLLAAGLDPKDSFDWDNTRPLYPGLLTFQEQDAAIFFGRENEIREGQSLLNQLQQFGGPRLTLILGASGSGKSSLMRAGLLPRLKQDQRWVVIDPFRPLKAPFEALATVLSQRFVQISKTGEGTPADVKRIRRLIRSKKGQTNQAISSFIEISRRLRESAGSRDATLLLTIDQYEELLGAGPDKEREYFLAFLRALLDHEDSGLMVLATLRSDFLGSFQDHPAMRGLGVESFLVPQMKVGDFASVIEGPAEIANLEMGPGLVQAMITDTKTSDALPLLAFTLRVLYEEFGKKGKRLTLEQYCERLGSLDGCISRAAEAVLTAKPLSEQQYADLRTMWLSMVRVNHQDQYAKQPVQWNDVPVSIHETLERFVTARLLIPGGEKGRTVEIAHEALFRAWPRLASWIGEDREELLTLWRAEIEGEEWQRQGYDLKYLWHADRLKKLRELVARRGPKSVKEIVRLFMAPHEKICESLYNASLSHQERIKIARLLLTIGDTRPGVGLRENGLPDIEWILIPEGQIQSEFVDRKFIVKSFLIAKYPVTHMQFQSFLTAEDGYQNKEWWKNIDYTNASQPRWPVANAPRETVSWYEAVAFCNWLSVKTKAIIRLPTAWEWRYAATGGDPQREYPWEGGWDPSRCNSEDSKLNQTTAVGMYPHGATVHGVLDMAGNVWEWCLNGLQEPAQPKATSINRINSESGKRVILGGSWNNKADFLRVSTRNLSDASTRDIGIGFRLVQDVL